MRRAAASAPAKVILVGEHFVVRGAPALVAAIDRRVRVTVEPAGSSHVVVESSLFRLKARPKDILEGRGPWPRGSEPIVALLRGLADRGYSLEPHRAVIESGVPVAAGLGSSASTAVAYALAYTAAHGDPLRGGELFDAAMEAERVAHEKPSGVDVAAAVEGGFLYYRRGEEPRRVDARLDEASLVVADTGVKRSTGDVVRSVLSAASSLGEAGDAIYTAGRLIVERALEAARAGDLEALGLAMNAAHGLLAALGASSLEIELLVHSMRRAGALGSKLTGAGRGGAVIALVRRGSEAPVEDAARPHAATVFRAPLGAPGARIEHSHM
jgi:mevalonate kinase